MFFMMHIEKTCGQRKSSINMNNKISFDNLHEAYPDCLKPIKTLVPQWYKDAPLWQTPDGKMNGVIAPAIKQCMPFLDSLTSGYAILLPADLHVLIGSDGIPVITWRDGDITILEARGTAAAPTLPIPHGYNPQQFGWAIPITFKVPDGYSVILGHPFNRFDLPFLTLTGIADINYVLDKGFMPFYIKEGFEGVIPQGTPIAQILPFKREDWIAEKVPGMAKESELNTKRMKLRISNWYRDNFWSKKTFN